MLLAQHTLGCLQHVLLKLPRSRQVTLSVSASLKRIHFRRFGVGHLTRRRVRNTPVRWLLHTSKQS
jgi:hypothetical protein